MRYSVGGISHRCHRRIGRRIGCCSAYHKALPRNCKAAIIVVFHVGAIPSQLPEILSWHGRMPVLFAKHGADLEPGRIYVAPPDHHVLLDGSGRIWLDHGSKVHNTRPAVDPLFTSAAAAFGRRVVGVVLSGRSKDGATGLKKIKVHGGLALVHDPEEAAVPEMPLTVTHEFLALLLGVRRQGITDALHTLEGNGLIRSTRSNVRILNRAGLRIVAGGFYGVPEAEYDRALQWVVLKTFLSERRCLATNDKYGPLRLKRLPSRLKNCCGLKEWINRRIS